MTVDIAVFTVGGLGTRFLPATKALPKEMLPIVDKPLIQYAVEEARDAGIDNFVFVTGKGKYAIEDHFDTHVQLEEHLNVRGKDSLLSAIQDDQPEPGRLVYVRQSEPLGLGHAVWCARHLVGDRPFAVLLPDELIRASTGTCLGELMQVHAERGGNVVSVIEVPQEDTHRYGIVEVSASNGRVLAVSDVVEKPDPSSAPSTYAIAGRYVLDPVVLGHLTDAKVGAGGEIQLTDAIRASLSTTPMHAVVLDGRRFDCGTKVGYIEANVALALERKDLDGDVEAAVRRALELHTGARIE
jgi:UTP--glucose-1-phosphate uridylyltransferase